MNKRIIGLETEYSLCFLDKKENRLVGSAYVRNQLQEAMKELGFSEWLENGGRLYIDSGDHPEYATPECSSALELVKYDKAGERILEEICNFLNHQYGDQGVFYFHKDNSDRKGSSFGSHENYLVGAEGGKPSGWLAEMKSILITFLATRQIFCGAGKIGVESVIGGSNFLNLNFDPSCYSAQNTVSEESKENSFPDLTSCVFQISQRADFIDCLTTASPHTGPKGFFSEKGDNHCLMGERLHIICGDSNMSEYSAWLKIVTTLIVISMLEERFITLASPDVPILDEPVWAVKEISRDISLKKKIPLKNGGQMSALEIQKWFLEKAIDYHSANPDLEIFESPVLIEWADTLDKLEKAPQLLAKKIDWLIKYELLNHYITEKNLDWRNSQVLVIDLEYHNIQRSRGIYYFLEQQEEVTRILNDNQIWEAKKNPPSGGRAVLRSAFVKFAKKIGLDNSIIRQVGWDSLGWIYRDIRLDDPWNFSYAEAVKLLKCLTDIIEELQSKSKK